MNNGKIKVSIIMSTYNESYTELHQSIESILNQTHKNIEFIIVSDNPKNKNIDKVVREYTDSRIVLICNSKNIGLVESLNKAIKASTGNYIARMDADDISIPDRIEKQLDYLTKKQLDLVGCWIEAFNDSNSYKQSFPVNNEYIKLFLRWGNCIPHPTWMVKKEVYYKLNGYRSVPRCEDYDFICRFYKAGYRAGNLNEYLLKYRVRENSISNSNPYEQYLIRRYVAKNRKKGMSMLMLENYLNSNEYSIEKEKYMDFVNRVQKKNSFIQVVSNKYLYITFMEKIGLKLRNHCKI